MKKFMKLFFTMTVVAGFSLVACNDASKVSLTPETEIAAGSSAKVTAVNYFTNVVQGLECSDYLGCMVSTPQATKRNSIKWNIAYGSSTQGAVYAIYKRGVLQGNQYVYNLLNTQSCPDQLGGQYAMSSMTNGGTYVIFFRAAGNTAISTQNFGANSTIYQPISTPNVYYTVGGSVLAVNALYGFSIGTNTGAGASCTSGN